MSSTLPSRYDHRDVEGRWYTLWESRGHFTPQADQAKTPYCIVIPPPNVTGILHMGHALNNTLQDILIRWKRMQGANALWVPGTDHAGIATQNVVERELAKQGQTRQALGRDAFLQRVWAWKEQHGRTIVSQLKRLGASCDWSRERFTMDEGLSRAVQEVFIRLYNQRLIYRWYYVVNWCPRCLTALSDEEVTHTELNGQLYYIRYPLLTWPLREGRAKGGDALTVATTRPETLLGDVAVAVNPHDHRYRKWIGGTVRLPIVGRELPVIADEAVEKDFGTGCLKITPGHDQNDYWIRSRHTRTRLPLINVMNPDGTMNAQAGAYRGLDRFECRKKIVADLEVQGHLAKIEPHQHTVGRCYRCNTVIEYFLSPQWFVRMKPLAQEGIEVVEAGAITIVPGRWKKVYLHWMRHIRDWCISRQIWWGHRIPAWYCAPCWKTEQQASETPWDKDQLSRHGVMVSQEPPAEPCAKCGGRAWRQDEDVLDTWFSSWLWPFSTLGWPDHTPDLKHFYPTQCLVTGQDILFFWIARMVMAGLICMKGPQARRIPFRDVYIHGIIRDPTGRKMSKSLGNSIDPVEIIDQYGADALRFSLISIMAMGQDIYLSRDQFEQGRNFANKLWNAARFTLMNLTAAQPPPPDRQALKLVDRWITSRLHHTIAKVTQALARYRFNEAARQLQEFFWHELCDWYLELAKPVIAEPGTQQTLVAVFDQALRLLHPIMPFITEELWQRLPHEGPSLMLARWPEANRKWMDAEAERQVSELITIVTAVRNIKSAFHISPTTTCPVILSTKDTKTAKRLQATIPLAAHLLGASRVEIGRALARPKHAASAVIGPVDLFVPLEGLVNVTEEARRLQTQLTELDQALTQTAQRLSDHAFLSKAPPEVVSDMQEKKERLNEQASRLKAHLASLR